MLKKPIRFVILSSAAVSEMFCFGSCLFMDPFPTIQPPLIGQLTQAWARAALRVSHRLSHFFWLPVSLASTVDVGIN